MLTNNRVSLFLGLCCLLHIHLGYSKSESNNVAETETIVNKVAAAVPEVASEEDQGRADPAGPAALVRETIEVVEATPLGVSEIPVETAAEATELLGIDSGEVFEKELEEKSEEEGKEKAGPTETDANAARIIEWHLQHRGGIEKIKTLRTLKIKDPLKEGKNIYNMTWIRRAPDQYSEEQYHRFLGLDHITVRAHDGNIGWGQEISPEPKPPTNMAKKEAASFAHIGKFYGPLVDWEAKGHNFAYLREVKVYDSPTYMLQGKLKDEPVGYYYFDTTDLLVAGSGSKTVSAPPG